MFQKLHIDVKSSNCFFFLIRFQSHFTFGTSLAQRIKDYTLAALKVSPPQIFWYFTATLV